MSTTTQKPANDGGNRVLIIGGGLAGLCAAHSALQHGGSVVLLDKSAFLGGNSTKASSGIAGTPTQAQIDAKVLDGVRQFTMDTNRSFHAIPKSQPTVDESQFPVSPLVKEMARLSGPSLDWLVEHFNCDLSVLGFMGGHSRPRTHRGKEKMPGMAITYALTQALEKVAKEHPERASIKTKVRVIRLVRDGGREGPVTGVVCQDRSGKQWIERGAVVIATGGYAADFRSITKDDTSLLARFAPQLTAFSTTNAEHATGDGVKIAEQVGAGLVDMERVQVHPTGLVDPKQPNHHTKFLCAEATRGAGGIVVDRTGKRFVDELGRRDHVSGAMLQNKANAPFYLVLNQASAKEMEHHCQHYVGRGLMKVYPTLADFCKESNVSLDELTKTIEQYQRDAARQPSSRPPRKGLLASLFGSKSSSPSTTAPAIPDAFGKTLFRNAEHFDLHSPVHVAMVTPVVHYTMGGVRVNEKTEVLDATTQKPVAGLYCAGEAAGGVHGKNRLGGNSLLDCVVFGKIAGESATQYLLQQHLGPFSNHRLNTIYKHLDLETLPAVPPVPTAATPPAASEVSTTTPPAAAVAPAAPTPASNNNNNSAGAGGGGAAKKFTRAEVAKHNKESDCWVIVHGQVLDLTKFLPDHPGGKQSIVMYAGRDCTKEFDIVHQVELIEKYTPESVIGVVSD